MNVALAQITPDSDDQPGNLAQHLDALAEARTAGADVVVFPELSLSGYLVDDPSSWAKAFLEQSIEAVRQAVGPMAAIVGAPWPHAGGGATNTAVVVTCDGPLERQDKVYLPNYGIYTEGQRFIRGDRVRTFMLGGLRSAILICEDAWHPALGYAARTAGAELFIHPAASPQSGVSDEFSSETAWQTINRAQALYHTCPVVFVNHAGTDRGVTFWGGSGIVGPDGLDGPSLNASPELRVLPLDPAVTRSTRVLLRMADDEDPGLALAELARVVHEPSIGKVEPWRP